MSASSMTTPSDHPPDHPSDHPPAFNTAAPSGYAAALAELDQILSTLERSDVDVDVLANQVSRAALLIDFCRLRINDAKLHIEQVVATVDPAS